MINPHKSCLNLDTWWIEMIIIVTVNSWADNLAQDSLMGGNCKGILIVQHAL